MASTSSSWTPLPGRHKVNIGSSLNRALKARKGPAPAKRNNLPDRDFYSVRYPFKPTSIDSTKPGSLEVKRGNDGNNVVTLEHPCSQSSDALAFPGSETPAKDWACVLIYDEETGTYTLEKVESFIALEHPERRRATAARPSPYPPSTSSHSASNSKNGTRQSSADVDADLEEAILDSLKEQDADSDEEEDIPLAVTQKQKPLPSAPVAAAPSRPTKSLPSKPRPQTTQASSQPIKKPPSPVKAAKVPPAPSTSQPKPKKAAKRATPTFSDAEEEVLSFGKPSQPKRSRPSPPPPAPAPAAPPPEPPRSRLELPGTFSMPTYSLPGPSNPPVTSSSYAPVYSNPHGKPSTSQSIQPSSSLPTTTTAAAAPLPVAAAPEDSDEDEDWDEVVAHDEGNANEVDPDAGDDADMEDAGEEIDMDLFGTMIEEQLGEGDDHTQYQQEMDFLAQGLTAGSPEPEPPRPMGAPMSMRELAGGDSDDDDTTSEESDDD